MVVIPDVIGDPWGPGFPVVAGNDGRGGFPVVAGNDGFRAGIVGMWDSNERPSSMSKVRMWTVMFWCCLAGVLVLSLMPTGVRLPDTGWDKSNHLLGFCALACTGLMAYPKRPAILLAGLLAYGGMIEVL